MRGGQAEACTTNPESKRLEEKVERSREIISRVLEEFRKPAVMWSSGKDSMVMLFLLRAMGVTCPVIFHRQPWQGHRYGFAERMIREWGLTVWDWPASAVGCVKGERDGKDGRDRRPVSLMHYYRMGSGLCEMPVDLYEPTGGQAKAWTTNYVCGLRDVLNRPIGDFVYPWDVVFHGHKSSDVDPLFGAVPLSCDVQMNQGGPALAFVLRDWTDGDVWEYTKQFEVPQQWDRYDQETGEENPDRSVNPDYLEGCTRCLQPDGPAKVFCPKLKCEVGNMNGQVRWVEAVRPSYMGVPATAPHSAGGAKREEQHVI